MCLNKMGDAPIYPIVKITGIGNISEDIKDVRERLELVIYSKVIISYKDKKYFRLHVSVVIVTDNTDINAHLREFRHYCEMSLKQGIPVEPYDKLIIE